MPGVNLIQLVTLGKQTLVMANSQAPIFRAKAWQRYIERHDEAIFPKLISPRVFFFLWLALGLLITMGLLTMFAKIPVYIPAIATVVETKDGRFNDYGDIVLAIFLQAEKLPDLKAGQNVFFRLSKSSEPMRRPILTVEPRIISPKLAQDYFSLSAGASAKISEAKAVAIAQFKPLPATIHPVDYLGSFYEAEVEVGTFRMISLLPVIGRFFQA